MTSTVNDTTVHGYSFDRVAGAERDARVTAHAKANMLFQSARRAHGSADAVNLFVQTFIARLKAKVAEAAENAKYVWNDPFADTASDSSLSEPSSTESSSPEPSTTHSDDAS